MNLEDSFATYLPWIDAAMREMLRAPDARLARHYGMMQYHMGWVDADFRPAEQPAGKRIRPVLCLITSAAFGGDPRRSVPAAAGFELLHNFSLLHDDIEDNSATRRHRPAAWTLFGVALACNAGDSMFSLALRSFLKLADRGVPADVVLRVVSVADEMCVDLTEGQYLDMAFESRLDVTVPEYFQMIRGKTAAMLAACAEAGALIAGARPAEVAACRRYGDALGIAFQLQDDILGIWGNQETTGKPAAGDIQSKKKSLPVLYALAGPQAGPRLRDLYAGPAFTRDDIPAVLSLLGAAGARAYTEEQVRSATAAAHAALADAGLAESAQGPLHELLDTLLERQA